MHHFILGAKGFIGGSCKAYFESNGHQVTCFDKTLGTAPVSANYFSAETHTLEEVFTQHTFDVCINAAGSGDVSLSVQYPQLDFDANCAFTFKVLESIRRYQPACKYFHISSAAVYGNPVHIPISEQAQLLPISPYGWHKLQAENICREFFELYQQPVVIVRPFSVYGPRLKKQLFWDWHIKAAGNDEVELWGTGNESRDFIYIDDLCRCFDNIISHADFQLSVYNVASGEETTIAEAAAIYFAKYGKQYRFNNKKKEGAPVNWRADITRIKHIGFEAGIELQTGINKLVEWQKNN